MATVNDPPFIRAGRVAAICGYKTVQTFAKHRDRLEREENFPLPLPTSRRPLLWRADQVKAWAACQGLPAGDDKAQLIGATADMRRRARTA